MARSPRAEYLDPSASASVFVICGSSRTPLASSLNEPVPTAGIRRVELIESLLRKFAQFFCISVQVQTVLTHEIRIVLKNHPDTVRQLDDAEVARRWLTLCPTVRQRHMRSREITRKEILALCSNTTRIANIRRCLSDISWFLRLLEQRISLFCNAEDGVHGHFWSTRFRAILLLDDMARWLASANVDLGSLWIDPDKPLCAKKLAAALQLLRESLVARGAASQSALADPTECSAADSESEPWPAANTTQTNTTTTDIANTSTAQLSSTDSMLINQRPADFLEILDRVLAALAGESPISLPSGNLSDSLELRLPAEVLTALLVHFDLLFSHVAGSPSKMAAFVTRKSRRRAWVRPAARELFRSCAP